MILMGGFCVVDLVKTPAIDAARVVHGACELQSVELGKLTQVMPFKGHHAAVKSALGVALPAPNTMAVRKDLRVCGSGAIPF